MGSSPLTAGVSFPPVVTKAPGDGQRRHGAAARAAQRPRRGCVPPRRAGPQSPAGARPAVDMLFISHLVNSPPPDNRRTTATAPGDGVGFQRAGSGGITQCRPPAQPAGLQPKLRNGQFGVVIHDKTISPFAAPNQADIDRRPSWTAAAGREGCPSEGSATLGDRLANDRRRGSWRELGGQAVVVLVDPLGLSPGGVRVPGAGVVPGGAKGLDVGGRVWLQALQDVLGEAS